MEIDFNTINPLSGKFPEYIAVTGFTISANQVTGEPSQMVLSVALDRVKASVDECSFPVCIPLEKIYQTEHHIQLKEAFKKIPFCVILKPYELKVYKNEYNLKINYIGYCSDFEIIDIVFCN